MKYYTLQALEAMYLKENPDWPEELIRNKARDIHRQLNTLDVSWKRSNRQFYSKISLYGERQI